MATPRSRILTGAVLVTPASTSVQERTAARMLVEEIAKRTNVHLPVSSQWPADTRAVIALGPLSTAAAWAGAGLRGAPAAAGPGREGYRVVVNGGARRAPTVLVLGERCARRAVRRGAAAPRAAHDSRVAADPRVAGDCLDSQRRPARPSARLSSEDERVRCLGRPDVGAIHPRPGDLRHQRDRADPAALGRCARQPALPAAADRHDGRDVAHRRRVRAGRLDLVSGDGPGLRRSETGGVRAEGMGRGVFEAAAHRRHLRARRRSGPHAAEAPDGAAREADGQPAQVPSEGADVDVAAGLHEGMDGRVLRDPEDRAGVAHRRRVRTRRCATVCPSCARRRPKRYRIRHLSGHHAQPAAASTRCRTGTSRMR